MGVSRKINKWDCVKEMARLRPMRDCCNLAYMVLKNAEDQIKYRIDNWLEINSKELSIEFYHDIDTFLSNAENLRGRFLPEDIDYCYAPTISGGDTYSSYLKKLNDKENFRFDVFTCSAGMKYKNYCCHLVRSTILGESEEADKNYGFMMSVKENLLENLRDGIELCEVYKAVRLFAQKKNFKLATRLEKEFGFELGDDFRKESVVINYNTEVIARKNMLFAININLVGLKEAGIEYNLYYSDTVIVEKDGPASVLTRYQINKIQKWTLQESNQPQYQIQICNSVITQ